MANVNFQLSGASLQLVDNAATVQRVNSPIATIVGQVTAAFYDPYFLVANPGPTVLVLPAPIVWNVFIRNISGTGTISVTGTPNGGAAWGSPFVMVPNSIFMVGATFASNPGSGGFTAISLSANGAGIYAEILLAA